MKTASGSSLDGGYTSALPKRVYHCQISREKGRDYMSQVTKYAEQTPASTKYTHPLDFLPKYKSPIPRTKR